MYVQRWSAEDVLRKTPSLLEEPHALNLLCTVAGCDTQAVVIRNADVLYVPAALEGGVDAGASFLRAAGGIGKLHGEGKPVILAQLLVEHFKQAGHTSTSGGGTLLQSFAKFANLIGKKLEEIPEIARRFYSACIIAVLSLSDRAQPEVCCAAMAVISSIATCDATVPDVKRSLAAFQPPSAKVTATDLATSSSSDGKIVTSRVIEILDILVRHHIGISFEPLQAIHGTSTAALLSSSATVAGLNSFAARANCRVVVTSLGKVTVSSTTQQRWLVALENLILFLRRHATLIAPKLPAVFEECAKSPALREQVCKLWSVLVNAVEPELLRAQGATFATNILSLEQVGHLTDGAVKHLHDAMKMLHQVTSREAFWDGFQVVLQKSSSLIASIIPTITPKPFSADEFVASFVAVIRQNASEKCHNVFVRALHSRLVAGSDQFAPSAASAELLVRTLLSIASAKDEQQAQAPAPLPAAPVSCVTTSSTAAVALSLQQLVAKCIGVIGAVAPQSRAVGTAGTSAVGAPQIVDMLHVEKWRNLVHEILQNHCMRALHNTSDSIMHDRVAHAVQQLFRICVCEERAEMTSAAARPLADDEMVRIEEIQKFSWWSSLPERTQRSLLPFMNTKYHSQTIASYDRRCPEVRPGMSFVEWRWNWYRNLVSRSSGIHAKIFDAVRNVAKRDMQLCSFLIPHIVLHVLRCGTENDVLDIFGEFSTALKPEFALGLEEHVHQLFNVLENVRFVETNLRRTVLAITAAQEQAIASGKAAPPPPDRATTTLLSSCSNFFSKIPQVLLVRGALAVNSPMQALRFLEQEQYLPTTVATVQRHGYLQKLFAELQDCESAQAVHNHTFFDEGDWGRRALSLEKNGQWALALQACEIHLQIYPRSSPHQACALRCLQHLGQLHLMAHYAKSLLVISSSGDERSEERSPLISAAVRTSATNSVVRDEIRRYANEAQWRLGLWDEIDLRDASSPAIGSLTTYGSFSAAYVDSPVALSKTSDPASIVAAVVALKEFVVRDVTIEAVLKATSSQRAIASAAAAAAAKESYMQAYPFVVCLHALGDIELVAKSIEQSRCSLHASPPKVVQRHRSLSNELSNNIDALLTQRLQVVQMSADSREILLALHRRVYTLVEASHDKTSRTWVQYAKLLNENGFHDAALNAARQAAQFSGNHCKAFTTYAKLLYARGDFVQAVEYAKSHANDASIHNVATRAKLLLYATNWSQELSLQSPKEIAESYKACLVLARTEKAHFSLGRFYDKLFHATKAMLEQQGAASPDTQAMLTAMETHALSAIEQYGSALLLGYKTHVIGLPRLLTLWLDCTAFLATLRANVTQRARADPLALRFNARIERLLLLPSPQTSAATSAPRPLSVVPACVLVTSISQLVSRLGHGHTESLHLLLRLLVSLLTAFPQQALWHLLPVYHNAKQPDRSGLVKASVIGVYQKSSKDHAKIVEAAVSITSCLIDICNAAPAVFQAARIEETTFARRLEKTFQTCSFVLPLISTLTPDVAGSFPHDPPSLTSTFAKTHIFHGFQGKVEVMSSLQKPKRINILTKGGHVVPFLCKGKDEPRKDLRMMDIAGLINNLFLDDTTSRRKNFSLRRYAVAALSEDTALIEWVEHTSVLRKVTDDAYAFDGTGVKTAQVKEWKKKVDSNAMTNLEMFQRHILPVTKPVMHQWLQRQFQQCSDWYAARGLFTQSCALWSVVGHILGVGDRHAENLMIDTQSGEILHIDFAYMFDKGETLEVPERVRFRLTQNLVDGMGVVGCDGPYRSACATALKTQARHKDALMTVLDTLLHDPLVEWVSRSSGRDKVDPKLLFARVARRLDGFLDLYSEPKEKDTFALSVDGQVAKLIHHSASIENLTRMYTWWMAWI